MENTLAISKALFDMYHKKFNTFMDEMKMHKLMYFSQRESLILTGSPLFQEHFLGWKYGPVLHSVRSEYAKAIPFSDIECSISRETVNLLSQVLDRYGSLSSWNLSILSHQELSWQLSRSGLEPSENGTRELSIEAIKFDANREKNNRSFLNQPSRKE